MIKIQYRSRLAGIRAWVHAAVVHAVAWSAVRSSRCGCWRGVVATGCHDGDRGHRLHCEQSSSRSRSATSGVGAGRECGVVLPEVRLALYILHTQPPKFTLSLLEYYKYPRIMVHTGHLR